MPRIPLSLALLALTTASSSTFADDRPADVILEEYDAIQVQRPDAVKRTTTRAVREARLKRQKALRRRADLAMELYRSHPDHERVARLMADRWELRMTDPKKLGEVQSEVE